MGVLAGNCELREGVRVRIAGLIARCDLNGKEGKLLEYITEEDRWKVWFDDGFGKRLRPDNLEPLGLGTSAAAAAQKFGAQSCSDFDRSHKKVYAAKADPTQPAVFHEGDPALATAPRAFVSGQKVRIVGLHARPELNGQECRVLDYDISENRWRLQMMDGSRKLFDAANVESWSEGASTSRASNDRCLAPGQRVKIVDLIARAELNGQLGTVVEFDTTEGRWKVRMDDGSGKMLKSANLELSSSADQIQGGLSCVARSAPEGGEFEQWQRVRVVGLKARPELNGCEGLVVAYDEMECRWKVRLDDGTGKLLKAANMQAIPEDGVGTCREAQPLADLSNNQTTVCPSDSRKKCNIEPPVSSDERNGFTDRAQQLGVPSPSLIGSQQSSDLLNASECKSTGEFNTAEQGQAVCAKTTGAASPSKSTFASGQQVRLAGLVARPELNGLEGTVVAFDEAHGRWKVRMQDGTGKLFKPENLESVEKQDARPRLSTSLKCQMAAHQDQVQIAPKRQSFYNGIQAMKIDDFWYDESAYTSTVDTETEDTPQVTRSTGDSNCATACMEADGLRETLQTGFNVGERVRISGLQQRPDLNGQEGIVVGCHDALQRWRVRLDDHTGKLIKAENLQRVCQNQQDAPHLCNAAPDANLSTNVPSEAAPVSIDVSAGLSKQGAHHSIAASVERDGDSASVRLLPGQHVEIIGLQLRPEINGQQGVLLKFDEVESRWKVRMADGTGKMFKASNFRIIDEEPDEEPKTDCQISTPQSTMPTSHGPVAETHRVSRAAVGLGESNDGSTFVVGQRIKVVGLVSRPDLNGSEGFVLSYESNEDRWKVRMMDGTGKMLKASNMHAVPLRPGQRVRVARLKSRAELNGQLGSLFVFEETEGFWKVRMDDGSRKMFRPVNLDHVEADESNEVTIAPTLSEAAPETDSIGAVQSSAGLSVGQRVRINGSEGTDYTNLWGTVIGFESGQSSREVRIRLDG